MRSSGFKPKALAFHPSGPGEGKVGRVKSLEPSVDASSSRAPHGWDVVAGCRDMPLRCGGRWPVSDSGQGDTVVPGVERAPTPTAARACETRKPRPVRRLAGKPTVRKAQFPSGHRMTKKRNAGGRKAAGNRVGSISALPLMGVDNRPDTGPGVRARKRADVVR